MGKFLVYTVSLGIAIAYINTWICIFWPWATLFFGNIHGMLLLIFLHTLCSMAVINYYKCCVTHAGGVPVNWRPPGTEAELEAAITNPEEDHRQNYNKVVRYCTKCKNFKPPRTHHCAVCQRCTLKFDHHCEFIDNCVGYYTHKYFVGFLVYSITALFVLAIAHSIRIVQMLTATKEGEIEEVGVNSLQLVALLMNSLMIIVGSTLVLMILIPHFYLLKQNITSVELWEFHWAKQDFGLSFINPYNKGFSANIQEVMGSSLLLWFLPLPQEGDGLHYPPLCSSSKSVTT